MTAIRDQPVIRRETLFGNNDSLVAQNCGKSLQHEVLVTSDCAFVAYSVAFAV